MNLFKRKTKQFKKIEEFDRDKPIRDLFDMYISSIDNSWELTPTSWHFNFRKRQDSTIVDIFINYNFNSDNIINFEKNISIRITTKGEQDSIKLDFPISDYLKERLYNSYVKYKNDENSKIESTINTQIQKFKSPFETEITRDNKLKKLFN